MLEHLCLSTKRTASVPSLQSHGRDCLLLADRQLKESLLTCLSFSSRLPTYLSKTFQICLPESGNRDLLVVTSGNTSSSLTMAFPASPNIPTSSNTYKNGPPHTHTHTSSSWAPDSLWSPRGMLTLILGPEFLSPHQDVNHSPKKSLTPNFPYPL